MRFFRPWLLILLVGMVLFIGAVEAMRITGNLNFFPTVILLGAFVVPIAFVAYFYDHVRHREISLPLITACFLVGGVLGVIAAGFLEYGTLTRLDLMGLLSVGVIEEGVKLIFPMIMFVAWRYRHEADGLLFGIAAGMGFAALETMGYGMVSFLQSRGDISTLEQVLVFRGFLSPAGHAAWTGFFCTVLWREREKSGHVTLNFAVIGAFVLAVILHTLWDVVNVLGGARVIVSLVGTLVIAAVSLTLVILRYREARKRLAAQGILSPN